MTTRIAAAIQLGPASPTIAETAARIVKLIGRAGEMGVTVATLPELALTPYFAAALHESDALSAFASPEENGAAMTEISAAAKTAGMVLAVPFAEIDKEALFNSMAFLDADGTRIGTFRKMHIPGQPEPKEDGSFTIMEKRYFTGGDLGFGAFDTAVGKIGGLICYDRRFPESYRSVAMNGAEIICVGYNTPVSPGGNGSIAKGRRASELAIRSGAQFTASYVLAAGKAGREGGVTYIGGSFIAAPDGEILAKARTEGDEIVTSEIDLEKVTAARAQRKYAENRRLDAYVI